MERRRTDRSPLSIDAAFRPRGGVKFPASVTDLTLQGGCIESGFLFERGSEGWLQLPTLSDWHARIVWRNGWRTGILFSTPYNDAVLGTVLARAGAAPAPQRRVHAQRFDALVSQSRGSRRGQIMAGLAVPPSARTPSGQQPSRASWDMRHHRIGESTLLYMRGGSVEAMVINVAESGLTVKADLHPYIGEPIALDVAYGDPIEGTVSWWQDGCFGIELARTHTDLAA